jgi:uncharacterized membrane protein YphA (DoxX/SURF4 family)
MLSIFPELLGWWFIVPFIFRIFLSIYLFRAGIRVISDGDNDKRGERVLWAAVGAITVATAVFLLIGLYVQIAGLLAAALALFALLIKRANNNYTRYASGTTEFYILFTLVSLSLVALGPGPFSIDLPL